MWKGGPFRMIKEFGMSFMGRIFWAYRWAWRQKKKAIVTNVAIFYGTTLIEMVLVRVLSPELTVEWAAAEVNEIYATKKWKIGKKERERAEWRSIKCCEQKKSVSSQQRNVREYENWVSENNIFTPMNAF